MSVTMPPVESPLGRFACAWSPIVMMTRSDQCFAVGNRVNFKDIGSFLTSPITS